MDECYLLHILVVFASLFLNLSVVLDEKAQPFVFRDPTFIPNSILHYMSIIRNNILHITSIFYLNYKGFFNLTRFYI